MTRGNINKHIQSFALPIVLEIAISSFPQQMKDKVELIRSISFQNSHEKLHFLRE